jgi:hypothetical protein
MRSAKNRENKDRETQPEATSMLLLTEQELAVLFGGVRGPSNPSTGDPHHP